MTKDTIKRRILSRLDWKLPKELYEWKSPILILNECGYQMETFLLKKGYVFRDALNAIKELAQEKVIRTDVKVYLVPSLKKGAK